MLGGLGHACLGMPSILQNNKLLISLGKVKLFCWFVTYSYTSREARVLLCCFSWVWSGRPKVLWNNKSLIKVWVILLIFCLYLFASCWISIEATNICSFGLVLSANQIVRCFKLKKLENYMKNQFDFFASIQATKNMLFWVMPQNTLGQSVHRIFYFWLVWFVNLITRGPLLHCTRLVCL